MSSRLVAARALLLSVNLCAFGCGEDPDLDELIPPVTVSDAGGGSPAASDSGASTPGTGTPGTGTPGTGTPGTGTPGTGTPGTGTPPAKDSGTTTPALDAGNPDEPGPAPEGGVVTTPDAGPGGQPGGGPGAGSCLDNITDYNKAGPFKFTNKNSGSVKIWVPTVPAGCKVPVIHLANGTGASCSNYQAVLERFASHGFISSCYENANTGAGTQGVMAFDTVLKMYPDLADKKLGSTGHSQGGQGSFTVLSLSEAKWGDSYTYAGLAIEPASGFGTQPSPGPWQTVYSKIKSPMFMFSGTADILVSEGWVMQGFNALADTVEAYNWSAAGATHIPVPNAETMEVGVPWFRWKLLGDQKACTAFKALLMGTRWKERKAQNAKNCQ